MTEDQAKAVLSVVKFHKEKKNIQKDLIDILYEANGTGSGADDILAYIYNGFKRKRRYVSRRI